MRYGDVAMPLKLIVGIAILAVGVFASLLLALWVGPWQAARGEPELSAVRANVTSLLAELRELLKAAPESDLAGTKELLQRADSLNTRTAAQLGGIQGRVQQVPQQVGPFSGFSWDKDGTLRDLEALRQALLEARSLTSEVSGRLERVSLAMLDLNRRVTDVDARVNAELKKMDSQVSSLLDPQRILSSIWLPILLAVATAAGGVSTIWLGWRKDRREAEELRLKLRSAEQNDANASALQPGHDAQQPLAGDAPQASRT